MEIARGRFILFFVFLLVSFYGLAQDKMFFTGGKQKQRISFDFTANLIVLSAELNGKEVNLVLDSGSSKTIIFGVKNSDSLQLNESKKIQLRGLGKGKPIAGIISKNNQIRIKSILGVNQTVYVVLDDKFDLSSKIGKTIHGIIGYNLLKSFVTDINYASKRITFYNPDTYKPKKSKKYKSFDIIFHDKKPYVFGKISLPNHEEKQVKLLVDSGSSDALWLFENEAEGIRTPKIFFNDKLGEGLSGSIMGKRSKITSFKLGSYVFNRPTTAFLDSVASSFARKVKDRNGSIGSRILKRFRLIIDYPHQKIYLKKTRNFDKEFKYNRAGMEVAYFGKMLTHQKYIFQNTLTGGEEDSGTSQSNSLSYDYKYVFKPLYGINHIRPNSPADLAGLKVNDILIEINGKPAHTYKIEHIIALFYGDVGDLVELLVERRGGNFQYKFKLEKLL